MRTAFLFLSISLLTLTACGDQAANAGSGNPLGNVAGDVGKALEGVGDVARQTTAAKSLAATLGELQSTLGGITDGATAASAKATLEGLVGKLSGSLKDVGDLGKIGAAVKAALGGNLDGLMQGVSGKLGSLLGNEQIKNAIGPVLEQLKGLIKV